MVRENQVVANFTKKLQEWGWFSFADNFRYQRRSKNEVFCHGEFFQQIKKINRDLNDSEISQGIGKLLSNKDHVTVFTGLQKGIKFTTSSGEKKFINFIDFKKTSNNYFSFVSWGQIASQNNKILEPDLILFVNHLPLVICEFKFGNIDWKEVAYNSDKGGSISKYQKELPTLFLFNAFNVLSNGQDYCIGTINSELFNYTPWRWENNNIFHHATFCDILQNFLVLDMNKKWRIIRYHQYACLQEISKIISQNQVKGGVVCHTTGSGKSDTMVFLAKRLRHEYPQCTIIAITDRNELDQQLFKRFQNYQDTFFTHEELIPAEKGKKLEKQLQNLNSGKIIFTTIQKFQESRNLPIFKNPKKVFVFIDEAHRSQNLKMGQENNFSWAQEVRRVFPEAFFLGFTATPKDETYHNIGKEIHKYSVEEALNDGIIVKTVYDIYKYSREKEFPSLSVKGEFFKEDYRRSFPRNSWLDGQPPKVMYVAQNIDSAGKVYRYLHQDPQFRENVCLITSDQNGKEERTNIERFKNTNLVNIAIVVDKLTTGFNMENLQKIYLDQEIDAPHRFFQKISRVNRKYPKKDLGFVLDLAGNKETLEKALEKYFGKSSGLVLEGDDEKEPWKKIENFWADFHSREELYQLLFVEQLINQPNFFYTAFDYCQKKSVQERKEFYTETRSLYALIANRWHKEKDEKDREFIKWCFKLVNSFKKIPLTSGPGGEPGEGEQPEDSEFGDFIKYETFIIPDDIDPHNFPFIYKSKCEEDIRQLINQRVDFGLPIEEWEKKLAIWQEKHEKKEINIRELNGRLTELVRQIKAENEKIEQEIKKDVHYPLKRQIIQQLPMANNQEFVIQMVTYFCKLNQDIPNWSQDEDKRKKGRRELKDKFWDFFKKKLDKEEREKILVIVEKYFLSKYYLEKNLSEQNH